MLNFNFLNNFRYWSEALSRIAATVPEKESHFRECINANNMQSAVWLVEDLLKVVKEEAIRQEGYHVMIINSWLGIPLVPLLCENLDIARIEMVEIDAEANDLSRIFNKHYIQDKHINIQYHTVDAPFAIHHLNTMEPDIVINMHCEQMYPLADLKVSNPYAIYAMQSSDVAEEMMGINVVKSTKELAKQLALTKVFSESQKLQETYTWGGLKFFDRFQVIGSKKDNLPESTT